MDAQHGGGAADSRLAAARTALDAAEAAARSRTEHELPSSARDDGEPDPYDVARQIALRQLSLGPRSRRQLEDKLRQRNCSEDVAATVLDRLTEVGLVDDEAFARMTVRSRQQTKGLASRALTHELRRKGVADEHIEAALEDTTPEEEREQARALARRRMRALHGLDRQVQARRLAGFLARKGYSAGLSFEVVREALDEAQEHRRD